MILIRSKFLFKEQFWLKQGLTGCIFKEYKGIFVGLCHDILYAFLAKCYLFVQNEKNKQGTPSYAYFYRLNN